MNCKNFLVAENKSCGDLPGVNSQSCSPTTSSLSADSPVCLCSVQPEQTRRKNTVTRDLALKAKVDFASSIAMQHVGGWHVTGGGGTSWGMAHFMVGWHISGGVVHHGEVALSMGVACQWGVAHHGGGTFHGGWTLVLTWLMAGSGIHGGR